MSLTKDEEAELKRYGYDLKDLVKNEFRHEEWVNEEGDMALGL